MIVGLMGVTGSGRTTVGKVLATELGWRFYDADDYHPAANIEKMHRGQTWLRLAGRHVPAISESIARKPGWIWGSLGRDRENQIGTRSMTPNWLLA